MGYITVAYGIDIDQLVAVKGSKDEKLLAEMYEAFQDELEESDPDDAISLKEALQRIVMGNVEPIDDGDHQYIYAMELLCQHLGVSLDGNEHIRYMDDLCWDTAMEDSRTPLGLPEVMDFPVPCYLTAQEVKQEYDRFKDVDTEDDDPEIEEAREEYVWWLKQCADKSLGLVTFCY